jgi:hypothetical protein
MIHSPALSTFLLTLSAPCVGNTITITLPTSLSWWPTKTIYISHFGAGAPAYGKSTIRLFLIVGSWRPWQLQTLYQPSQSLTLRSSASYTDGTHNHI